MLFNMKLFATILTIFVLIAMFFALNSSYQDSFEARFYYAIDDFEKAEELATRAYEKDPYNKMAFTVLMQSKISKKYTSYIDEGRQYLRKITDISSKDSIDDADKARIKLICEVMIDSYKSLASSKLTSQELKDEAYEMMNRFERLYNELFK